MKKPILFFVMMFFCINAFAEDFDEGIEYERVPDQATESGDKIEVLEFFWYGCPHCYVFEPVLQKWLANKPAHIEFVRVPAVFRPTWKVHARTYYALQVMGLGEKFHENIFEEVQKNKKALDTVDAMGDFLAKHDVDKENFTEVFHSFSVDNMVRKANKRLKGFKISGVPAMAVNGKYVVSGRSAGSYEKMLKIVDYLVEKEVSAKK